MARLAAGAVTLVILRLALTSRLTVWIAALAGTLTVAAIAAVFAWLFGHAIEIAEAPSVAAVAGALLGALVPAWAYAHIARRRASDVRDSLIAPISAPRSR